MKKLDMRGVAHDVVIIGFVAIFAIAGVAYLVASHADSCTPTSGAVSTGDYNSPSVSGSVCPVSSPTSSPTPTDTQKPSAPAGLSAGLSAASAGVSLRWTASKDNIGVNSYSVWRINNNAWTQIGTIGGTSTASLFSYTDNKVSASTTYWYYVRAADKAGNVSDPSNTVSIITSAPRITLAATCSITGVPSSPRYNQTIRPLLTITNTGNQSFSPHIQNTLNAFNATGKATRTTQLQNLPSLSPGKTYTERLSESSVPYAQNSTATGGYLTASIVNTNTVGAKFSCGASFKLPVKVSASAKPTI